VRTLLEDARTLVNEKDQHGWTALHWAVCSFPCDHLALIFLHFLTLQIAVSEEEVVRWLLGHRRLRVAICNKKGETPLHLAAREGSMTVCSASRFSSFTLLSPCPLLASHFPLTSF
jgi:ankyrin repeat protein